MAVCSLTVWAQNGPMKFAGPSTFGVEEMNAWQDNECDTLVFEITSFAEFTADITLPSMTYNEMMLTIPSITIHGLKFNFDLETRNAVFEDQTYSETVELNGFEKEVRGISFTGEYIAQEKTLVLETKVSLGSMPVVVTYKVSAVYVPAEEETTLQQVQVRRSATIYDLSGCKMETPMAGQLFIVGDKKCIVR